MNDIDENWRNMLTISRFEQEYNKKHDLKKIELIKKLMKLKDKKGSSRPITIKKKRKRL